MLRTLLALSFLVAACSPAAEAPKTEPPAEAAVAPDYGPYANSWNSSEVSRFTHTLHAPTLGEHAITLAAQTKSPSETR